MRVLFLNASGTVGGAERVLLDVLRSLHVERPELAQHLIVPAGTLAECARELRHVDVEVLDFPDALASVGESVLRFDAAGGRGGRAGAASHLARGLALARYAGQLRARIEAARADVVHSNTIKTHLLAAGLAGLRTPLVWHLHDFLRDRPLTSALLRIASPRATVAVANSHAVASDARQLLPRLRVEVVHNGVDLERFAPGAGDAAELDRLAGLPAAPAGTVRVGLVATYARWKGQDLFLRAAARASASSRVPLRFYVVGGPIYQTAGSQFSVEELQALARELGVDAKVGFVPFQPETSNVFRALDVFVHASTLREPFGLTIVEAMACGRAAIVAREGGASELFTEGQDAVGYRPRDVQSLAEAVLTVVSDAALRERLGGAARKNVESRFDARRLGAAFAALYERLAGA